jgi:hypothetical protein
MQANPGDAGIRAKVQANPIRRWGGTGRDGVVPNCPCCPKWDSRMAFWDGKKMSLSQGFVSRVGAESCYTPYILKKNKNNRKGR